MELERIEGLDRIRISSIEPNLLTDEVLELVAASNVLCHHFHIPLQSGNDEILRSMRRRYRTDQYAGLIHRIISRIPDCGIGVDLISGFPGETEAHFESTCRFIEDLPVSYLHVFTYSERPNTPARNFAGVVRPEERFRRSRVLRTLGNRKKAEFLKRMIGRTETVLFESEVEDNLRFGLTSQYVRVGIPAPEADENTLGYVRILSTDGEQCEGRLAGKEAVA
jgi:threonylcarbamoyladenosine tRNA methylthiotransferase MtaB